MEVVFARPGPREFLYRRARGAKGVGPPFPHSKDYFRSPF